MAEPLLIESGIVTRIEADKAWVNTQSKLACSSCRVESTCGNGLLEKYLAGKVFISKLDNDLAARVGDQVEIAIPKSSVTQASLMAYLVPLIGLFLGAAIGQYLFVAEWVSILFAALGFVSGLFLTKRYNAKVAGNPRFMPKMVSKINTGFDATAFESIKIRQID